MKAKKLYILPLLSLLSSCVSSIPLRSDISDFIASFSLESSLNTYVNAGYRRHKKVFVENVKTEEFIEMSFNISDVNHPTYSYEHKTYKDDVLESTVNRNLVYKNEKIFYVTEDGETEYSLSDCRKLINTYFYTQTSMDGLYHSGAWYYGDFLTEMARELQNFITINSDKTQLIFERNRTGTENGYNATTSQKYNVNTLGMLERYDESWTIEDGRYLTDEIVVFKN